MFCADNTETHNSHCRTIDELACPEQIKLPPSLPNNFGNVLIHYAIFFWYKQCYVKDRKGADTPKKTICPLIFKVYSQPSYISIYSLYFFIPFYPFKMLLLPPHSYISSHVASTVNFTLFITFSFRILSIPPNQSSLSFQPIHIFVIQFGFLYFIHMT